jgi:hypothetical protein
MEIELTLKNKDYFIDYFPENGANILENLRKQIESDLNKNGICIVYSESYDEHGDCLFKVINFNFQSNQIKMTIEYAGTVK